MLLITHIVILILAIADYMSKVATFLAGIIKTRMEVEEALKSNNSSNNNLTYLMSRKIYKI